MSYLLKNCSDAFNGHEKFISLIAKIKQMVMLSLKTIQYQNNKKCYEFIEIKNVILIEKLFRCIHLITLSRTLCISNNMFIMTPPFELYSPVFYQTLSLHKYTSREYLNVLVLLW